MMPNELETYREGPNPFEFTGKESERGTIPSYHEEVKENEGESHPPSVPAFDF